MLQLTRAQIRHDQDVKNIHGVDMQEERRRRDVVDSHHAQAEDENRHSRELGDLDREEALDAMARRRHQVSLFYVPKGNSCGLIKQFGILVFV